MKTCNTCHFCQSFHSFGGRNGKSGFGFDCKLLNERLFYISFDEAKTMGVPILADFRNNEGYYWRHVEDESLDDCQPHMFTGIPDYRDDLKAFWHWALDCPCIASEQDLCNYIDWTKECAGRTLNEFKTRRDELRDMREDIREAARMVREDRFS